MWFLIRFVYIYISHLLTTFVRFFIYFVFILWQINHLSIHNFSEYLHLIVLLSLNIIIYFISLVRLIVTLFCSFIRFDLFWMWFATWSIDNGNFNQNFSAHFSFGITISFVFFFSFPPRLSYFIDQGYSQIEKKRNICHRIG